jgi:hypothetical protein
MWTHGIAALATVTAATSIAATPAITASGVRGVNVGSTYSHLRDRHLIGKIHHGCELGGSNTRSARLRAPLKGQVNFTLKSPRRVTDVTVTGGATARGVAIGDGIADIKAAYPKAKVDHSTDSTFELTLVRIPKSGGGRLMFAVSTKTKRITEIGIPIIGFCE